MSALPSTQVRSIALVVETDQSSFAPRRLTGDWNSRRVLVAISRQNVHEVSPRRRHRSNPAAGLGPTQARRVVSRRFSWRILGAPKISDLCSRPYNFLRRTGNRSLRTTDALPVTEARADRYPERKRPARWGRDRAGLKNRRQRRGRSAPIAALKSPLPISRCRRPKGSMDFLFFSLPQPA